MWSKLFKLGEMNMLQPPSESTKIAIIGTREPDANQAQAAADLARELSKLGYFIATGGADGIDNVAMSNTRKGKLLVYLPWHGYNAESVYRCKPARVRVFDRDTDIAWAGSVRTYHPRGNSLTRGPFALHARNFGIVENSALVIAFPGYEPGGTGQGMRIAEGLGIPLLVYEKGWDYVDSVANLLGAVEAALAPKEVA